jgi:hypothetical protein
LACTSPCRRFADILAEACARLGVDAVRYSFIVVDSHHLLLAGLPAHLCENAGCENLGDTGSVLEMRRFVEGEDRRQGVLLPEFLNDYVSEENPVRVIDVFVEELDLGRSPREALPRTRARACY